MDNTKRKDNETWISYAKRLIDGRKNDIYDLEKKEIFYLLFDQNLSTDEGKKQMQGVEKTLNRIDEDTLNAISDDDIAREVELQIQELKKERMKNQVVVADLTKRLREESRFELFTEQVTNAIKEIEFPRINTKYSMQKPMKTSGVLMLADAHYGKDLIIKGLNGEILNEYSPEIFEDRMWKLLEKTKEICNKENLDSISILSLGDELEGFIRISQLMSLRYGVVDSAIKYAYFMITWLNELSIFVNIDFYSTAGNHTDLRLITGVKNDFPHENISKIINVILSLGLKNNPNIIMHNNETDKIYVNIQGFNILGLHGEEKNISQTIRDFQYIYNTNIDYLIYGHKHHSNNEELGFSKGCIGVGSVIGIDDYSMKLKRISDPSATFIILEEEIGKTIEYRIKL
jgi:predicted phosphodiesterase